MSTYLVAEIHPAASRRATTRNILTTRSVAIMWSQIADYWKHLVECSPIIPDSWRHDGVNWNWKLRVLTDRWQDALHSKFTNFVLEETLRKASTSAGQCEVGHHKYYLMPLKLPVTDKNNPLLKNVAKNNRWFLGKHFRFTHWVTS